MKELKRKEVEENLRILVNWDSVRGGNETIYQEAINYHEKISLTDQGQALLIKIAKNKKNSDYLRFEAMKFIKDENIISKIYCTLCLKNCMGDVEDIYIKEIYKIKNPNLLAKIIFNNKFKYEAYYYKIKEAAVEQIDDDEILFSIAMKKKLSYSVKQLAVEKINDETILKSIVIKSNDNEVLPKAIRKINDRELLNYLHDNVKNKWSKKWTKERSEELKLQDKIGNDPVKKEFFTTDWLKVLKENTDVYNPRYGEIKWSYGDSQKEIKAEYKKWKLKGVYDSKKMVDYMYLELTHSSGFRQIVHDNEVSSFLLKIL